MGNQSVLNVRVMTKSGTALRPRIASSNSGIGPTVSKSVQELLNNSIREDLILTPHVEDFLSRWNGDIPRWVARRVLDVMGTPDRDRSGSWSGSMAGDCLRRQELQFIGVSSVGKADSRLQMIFLNGTFTHLRWQATLLTAGLLDGIEITHRKPSWNSRCTLDGIGKAISGRYGGREFGFELKSRNEWAFNSQTLKGVDQKTRKQVDFEFLITGLDLFVIMNENKNNQQPKEWVFARDEDRVRDMRKQVKDLNRAVDTHKLHPQLEECRKQLKSGEFYKCPFGGPGGPCAQAGSWPRRIK